MIFLFVYVERIVNTDNKNRVNSDEVREELCEKIKKMEYRMVLDFNTTTLFTLLIYMMLYQ